MVLHYLSLRLPASCADRAYNFVKLVLVSQPWLSDTPWQVAVIPSLLWTEDWMWLNKWAMDKSQNKNYKRLTNIIKMFKLHYKSRKYATFKPQNQGNIPCLSYQIHEKVLVFKKRW